MPRIRTLTSMLVVACAIAGTAGCEGDNAIAPDAVPLQILEGTRPLPLSSLAVVPFQINQAGTLRSTVDWNNFASDVDTAIMLGTCTADQINQGGGTRLSESHRPGPRGRDGPRIRRHRGFQAVVHQCTSLPGPPHAGGVEFLPFPG